MAPAWESSQLLASLAHALAPRPQASSFAVNPGRGHPQSLLTPATRPIFLSIEESLIWQATFIETAVRVPRPRRNRLRHR